MAGLTKRAARRFLLCEFSTPLKICHVSFSMIAIEYMKIISNLEILRTLKEMSVTDKKLLATMHELSAKTDKKIQELSDKTDRRFDELEQNLTETIHAVADHVDERFDQAEQNATEATHTLAQHMDESFAKVDERLTALDGRLKRVEPQAVTRSYLDEKLGVLKGDLVTSVKKSDQKVDRVVTVLEKRKVLTAIDIKEIQAPAF